MLEYLSAAAASSSSVSPQSSNPADPSSPATPNAVKSPKSHVSNIFIPLVELAASKLVLSRITPLEFLVRVATARFRDVSGCLSRFSLHGLGMAAPLSIRFD